MFKNLKFRSFVRTMGFRGYLFFFLSIPFGLIQGFIEILFGFSLVYFLSDYGLVTPVSLPPWFPSALFTPTLMLVLVGFIRWISGFLSVVVTNLCHENFCYQTRKTMAASMLSVNSQNRISVAEMSNVFANLMPKAAMLIMSISDVLTRSFLLAMTLFGMLYISVKLTGVMLGFSLILVLPVIISRKFYMAHSALLYELAKKFIERLSHDTRNLDFLRIIGKAQSEIRVLIGISDRIYHSFLKYISWITSSATWPQFGAVGLIVFVTLINAHYSWIPKAQLIPFIYLLSRLTTGLGEVMRGIGSIEFNLPFAKSITDYLNENQELLSVEEVSPENKNNLHLKKIIEVSAQNLSIGRTHPLLKNISFTAKEGDFVWIHGQSGMGKTTLLMTLIGLLPPLEGKILWDGLSPFENKKLLDSIAYSGADPFLLDGSIRNNLLLGNEAFNYSDEKINFALKKSKCEFVDELPEKLDSKLSEGGEGISAGQKQRLSIARALLRQPSVLLLDEATANIDIDTEKIIVENIKSMLPNSIIFAVSHRHSLGEFATQRLTF